MKTIGEKYFSYIHLDIDNHQAEEEWGKMYLGFFTRFFLSEKM